MTESGDRLVRCGWAGSDPLYIAYHDQEWGVPTHDDQALFELLMLETFQAGLSWITILRKREAFRRAFDGWDAERIAAYEDAEIARLLADPGIIRNRAKIQAAIRNAEAYLALRRELGSFDRYIWSFAPTAPRPRPTSLDQIPVATPEAEALSRDLRKRGFRFVGPTSCYAFMQSAGLVDDHIASCFRAGAAQSRQPMA